MILHHHDDSSWYYHVIALGKATLAEERRELEALRELLVAHELKLKERAVQIEEEHKQGRLVVA